MAPNAFQTFNLAIKKPINNLPRSQFLVAEKESH
jgi:hypothetical protein